MEIKTIDDIKNSNLFGNSNYDYIIEQSMSALTNNNLKTMNIGDTPISPMTIDDDLTPILLSEEVTTKYRQLVELINNPETAKEYSYVLLGKSALIGGDPCYFINKIIDCNSDTHDLSNRITHVDVEKLNDAISYAARNNYNFISLGHTHPSISDEEKKNTLAHYLPKEVKDSEYIREAGLNLSLQDFVSYEVLHEHFADNLNIRTTQTVIMHNGEMVMFGKQNGNLKRFSIIMDITTGESIYVSSKEEMKENKQIYN